MKKILVVDDEKGIRDLLKEALMKDKFSVITVASGQEAIVMAKKDKPHLILLDIAMPGMDGYATCEALQKDPETKDIRVLFLTGKDLDEQSVIERCQTLCSAGYISKLSSLKELLEKVKEALFRS